MPMRNMDAAWRPAPLRRWTGADRPRRLRPRSRGGRVRAGPGGGSRCQHSAVRRLACEGTIRKACATASLASARRPGPVTHRTLAPLQLATAIDACGPLRAWHSPRMRPKPPTLPMLAQAVRPAVSARDNGPSVRVDAPPGGRRARDPRGARAARRRVTRGGRDLRAVHKHAATASAPSEGGTNLQAIQWHAHCVAGTPARSGARYASAADAGSEGAARRPFFFAPAGKAARLMVWHTGRTSSGGGPQSQPSHKGRHAGGRTGQPKNWRAHGTGNGEAQGLVLSRSPLWCWRAREQTGLLHRLRLPTAPGHWPLVLEPGP
jgi:hypothetical protein